LHCLLPVVVLMRVKLSTQRALSRSYEVLTQTWCVQLQVLRLYARDAALAAAVTALLCRL
jgi:hypothetical protein